MEAIFVVMMLFFSAFEGVVYAGVLHLFLSHTFKRNGYRFAIMAVLSVAVIIGSAILELPFPVKSLLVLALLILAGTFIYKAPAHKVTFITVTVFYLNMMADMVVGNIFSGIFDQPINQLAQGSPSTYILMGCIVHVVQLGFAVLLNQYFKRVVFHNPLKYWLLLDLIVILSYLISALFAAVNPFLQTLYSPFLIVLAVVAFVLINAIVIYLFSQMSKQAQREKQTILHEAMAEKTIRDMKENRRLQEEFHRISHEWKNYNAALSYDLSNGNVDGALERIKTAGLEIPPDESRHYTGNGVVDYCLTGKMALAAKKGITAELDCAPIGELNIEPSDVISVISNLLDNAIEASEGLPEQDRHVKVMCKCSDHYFLITVENPHANEIMSEGGRMLSSKPDSGVHGYGIAIAQDICEKYHGDLHTSHDDKMFIARASFKI